MVFLLIFPTKDFGVEFRKHFFLLLIRGQLKLLQEVEDGEDFNGFLLHVLVLLQSLQLGVDFISEGGGELDFSGQSEELVGELVLVRTETSFLENQVF